MLRGTLVILFAFISILVKGQKPEVRFNHITATDGLSHTFIRNMIQDDEGFIWVATPQGLNKLNGTSVVVYKHYPGNKSSLNNNDVWELLQDSKKRIWVGTREGLCYYNKEEDVFVRDSALGRSHINYLFEDKKKRLWVIGESKLYRYNELKNGFFPFQLQGLAGNVTSLYQDKHQNFYISTNSGVYLFDDKNDRIIPKFDIQSATTFYEDEDNFWIGSKEKGIVVYNNKTKKIKTYITNPCAPDRVFSNLRIKGDSNYIYIGTENNGLVLYDKKTQDFYNYIHNPSDPESLSFNTVYSILIDRNNTVWIGTFSGIDIIKKNKFKLIRHRIGETNTLSHNSILSFTEDIKGNILVGTDGGGLNVYNRRENTFTVYKGDPKNPKALYSDAITFLKKDRDQNIWIGGWGGGLHLFDQKKGEFQRFYPDPINPEETLSDPNVVQIQEDKEGYLWIGTSRGVDRFDKKTGKFSHYSTAENKINEYISSIYEDREGTLWVGTFRGLYILDKKTKTTTPVLNIEGNEKTISSDVIFSITEDSKGRFWVCTLGGLNLFDKKRKTFSVFREADGLPTDAVMNIQEDNLGFLWIATTSGLSKFNFQKKTFKNFNVGDGLQDNEFKGNAYYKLSTGELLYGGPRGFNIFHPSKIVENHISPPVIITELMIFNKPMQVGAKDSPLQKSLSHSEQLVLSHNQSVFTLNYVALNFISPEKNQYAYKLVGLEKDWNYVGNQKTATYTNLDPGEYLFWVKASNNDGYWNEEGAKLKIVIKPPYWKTWWFNLIVGLSVLGGFVGFFRLRVRSINSQKKILEEQVKLRTFQLNQQAETLKLANRELSEQKEEIESQKTRIQDLYTDIKDSVRAAQDIQQIILPSQELLSKYLGEHFILLKPKDLVSGDFYWFTVKDKKILIATADCTGHGISGAFMSIHGHHLLNQVILSGCPIVASEILNQLHRGVMLELDHHGHSKSDFSMDISLCVIDMDKSKLQYSGANGALYLVRNKQLTEIKGNKFSIGLTIGDFAKNYKNNEIPIKKGDIIYLFSDGYADQLGGPYGTQKFMYSKFRELLKQISGKEMTEQSEILENQFNNWKGREEQVDDILVMGIKI